MSLFGSLIHLNNVNKINSNDPVALPNAENYSWELSKQNLNIEQKEALSSCRIKTCVNVGYDTREFKIQPDKGSTVNGFDSDTPKVLVVDDHAASRMTAVALLAMEGYKVIEADSGSSAVDLVTQNQPDLILLDIMMPGIDGFEVCQLLKQDEATRLIPIIFVTALNDRRSRIRGIEVGADDFLSKPFDRIELAARVKSLVKQKRLNEDLDHAEQVLFSIARSIESRDPNTGDHCERLVTLGKAFGEYLNLSRNQIRDLMWGGYLHDIGKVGIPDSVLLKKGKLTSEEWKIMKQHVLIGEKICQPLRSMQGVIPIIRHHHECWDGSGYPDGLKGEKIPYLAQIFQIIDIYDALTSERPYKVAFSPEEALAVMQEETAKGWRNPHLMQQFVEFNRSYQP
ncbi:two-component system response regulator [Mastigocladus laminosus UU774]|nr:two-component system response regulator [Mastigocladus laminosus UU774]